MTRVRFPARSRHCSRPYIVSADCRSCFPIQWIPVGSYHGYEMDGGRNLPLSPIQCLVDECWSRTSTPTYAIWPGPELVKREIVLLCCFFATRKLHRYYQECCWASTRGRCGRLTPSTPSLSRWCRKCWLLTSHNPLSLHGPLQPISYSFLFPHTIVALSGLMLLITAQIRIRWSQCLVQVPSTFSLISNSFSKLQHHLHLNRNMILNKFYKFLITVYYCNYQNSWRYPSTFPLFKMRQFHTLNSISVYRSNLLS